MTTRTKYCAVKNCNRFRPTGKTSYQQISYQQTSYPANFKVNDPSFKTYMTHAGKKIFPDPCHRLKLVRNALQAYKCFVYIDGNDIKWEYFAKLSELQMREGLRAGNKLTVRHTNFTKQKMKVKLAVQLLSSSVGSAMSACEQIGVPEFKECAATSKFAKIMDRVFDALNSHPGGKGYKAPLAEWNKRIWKKLFADTTSYLLSLRRKSDNCLILNTKRSTFVVGLVVCGRFSWNCQPQGTTSDVRLSIFTNKVLDTGDEDDEMPNLPSFLDMSPFVTNVVTYIAGFVGRKVCTQIECVSCVYSLYNSDVPSTLYRSDFILVNEKNNGGLFIPSDDLITVCKITEQSVRAMHTLGTRGLTSPITQKLALQEVLKEPVFRTAPEDCTGEHSLFGNHTYELLEKLISYYTKIRLHHISKEATLNLNSETLRNHLTKAVLFRGQ